MSIRLRIESEVIVMRMLMMVMVFVFGGLGQPALADQDDPRLDALFGELSAAGSSETAEAVAAEIWTIWHEVDDPASERLLRQGSDAMARRLFPIAINSLNRLVDRSPAFAEAWNRRATLHYIMGDDEASIRDIEQTLALEPRHFGALSGLGLIMMRNDRPEAALRSFEAALEVHPHLPAARAHVEPLRRMVEGSPT